MNSKPDDGATKQEQKPLDCPDANGIMHSHKWEWVWDRHNWTNNQKCMNCGAIKQAEKK